MTVRRILAIDGGGIRGLLPAMLLAAVEHELNDHCHRTFDLVAGTSTGGILASGIYAGVSADRLVALYRDQGHLIFQRSVWQRIRSGLGLFGPRYRPEALELQLHNILGHGALSYKASFCELLVPTYVVRLPCPLDIDHDGVAESASAFFFKSWEARRMSGRNFLLRDICRATSAAPTYFPAADIEDLSGDRYVCVDGGVFANNPTLCAWAAARKLWPNDEIRVVSLGTGSKVNAIHGSGDWGIAGWGGHVSQLFMDGAADTVSYIADELLDAKLVRAEIALEGVNERMDAADPINIKALSLLGQRYADKYTGNVIKLLRG